MKLDSDVTIVAMADGSSVPLPPGSGMVDKDGKVGACLVVVGRGDASAGAGCAKLSCAVQLLRLCAQGYSQQQGQRATEECNGMLSIMLCLPPVPA